MINMVPAKKTSTREPRVATSTSTANASLGSVQARYLVAEYLRDWGLRDPDIIAAESRRIVDQAATETLERHGTIVPRTLCATAIHLTMAEVEAAIASMAASSCRPGRNGLPANHAVVPHIARLLMEFPDAIQHRDRPPAKLLQVLESSVTSIVPHPYPREMLAQPSTRLCSLFRVRFWAELCGRFRTWVTHRVGVS